MGKGQKGQWAAGPNGEMVFVKEAGLLQRSRRSLSQSGKTIVLLQRAVGIMMKRRRGRVAATIEVTPVQKQQSGGIFVTVRGKKIEERVIESASEERQLGFSHSFTRRSGSTFYVYPSDDCGTLLRKVARLAGSLEDAKVIPRGWKKAYGLHDIPSVLVMDLLGNTSLDLELYVIDEHKKRLRKRWHTFLQSTSGKKLSSTVNSRVWAFLAPAEEGEPVVAPKLPVTRSFRRIVRSSQAWHMCPTSLAARPVESPHHKAKISSPRSEAED